MPLALNLRHVEALINVVVQQLTFKGSLAKGSELVGADLAIVIRTKVALDAASHIIKGLEISGVVLHLGVEVAIKGNGRRVFSGSSVAEVEGKTLSSVHKLLVNFT